MENPLTNWNWAFNKQIFIHDVCFLTIECESQSDCVEVIPSIDSANDRNSSVKVVTLGMSMTLDYSIDQANGQFIKKLEDFIIFGTGDILLIVDSP